MLLSWLFRAATPENPRWSLNDPAAVDAFLGGETGTSSGERVSIKTALSLPAFWRGVNLLSNYVAKLPLYVYKRVGEGKERATDHPAYQLLRWRIQPDPRQPLLSGVWKRTIMGHALTKGNGYTYIFRNGDGSPSEGLILDPACTYPVRENGVMWYVTTVDFGDGKTEMRKLRPEDVHHIHGLGYDGVQGYDLITYAREALGRAQAMQKYGSIYFRNSARPNVVLLFPGTMAPKDVDELRARWERMHAGLNNAHRTAILDRGLTIKELSINARDSQLVEREKLSLVDMANILGLPVHKLGSEGRTAYASLEQENQAMLDDGLDPWLVHWEEECREKFLTEEEKAKDTHSVEFLRAALVRANLVDRANYYRTALGGRPWMLPDEVRGLEDQNPLGGEAAEYLNPLNMGQGGADNEPAPGKPPAKPPVKPAKPQQVDDAEAGARRELLTREIVGMVRRVGKAAAHAAKEPKTFPDWVDGIQAEHGETIQQALSPIGVLLGQPGLAASFWWELQAAFAALAERATAKTLAAEVAKLNAELEANLPKQFGGDHAG